MSIGSSLSGVNFSGISSGIDTESIISKLMQIEALPIQRLQTQQAQLAQTQGLLNQFKSRLTSIATAAGALNMSAAFNPISSLSSNTDVATITTGSGSIAGTYQLLVSKLAQSHKISSAPQANASSALNLTGTVVVNGKGVTLGPNDTLTNVAQKINSAGAGVTASIIDGGTGNAFLTITSTTSGAKAKVQIADLTGNVADALGLTSGAAAIRETITGGETSYNFKSSSTPISSMMNLTGTGSKSFDLNGTTITVDTETTSLQGVANLINSSGSGASATVRSVTDSGGTTSYKLDITGVTSQTDTDHLLQGIGVLQQGFGTEMINAQDAEFKLDNVSLTSSTNTLTTVIPGATITLLKANTTTPESSTLSLTRDDTQIKKKLQDFADAYNSMVDYVSTNSKFDTNTFDTGGLFGNSTVQQVESALSSTLFATPSGMSGAISNLTQLGFGLDADGKITINDTTLTSALSTNLDGVSKLFRAVGSSTNNQLSYVASTTKTKASGAAGFAVNITQAATQHALLGEVAQSSALTQQEVLTFGGSLVGSQTYDLILDAGLSQAQVVDKINSDAKLKDLVSASVEGGKLKLTAKKYGTPGAFTVSSNRAAAADQSGLGSPTIATQGLDVAGTINGETAIGSGQLLTGTSNNATTDGIQLLYTGTATGTVGSLVFTKGVSPTYTDLIQTFTDSVNGLLTANDKSLQDQMDTMQTQIGDLTTRMGDKQVELRARFSKMEQAISQLHSQSSSLTSMMK